MTTSATTPPRRYPGRPLVALGFGLTALGIIAYVIQIAADHLKVPWYLPISAMLGVACVTVALWRARSVWRVLALMLLFLAAGAEWALVLGSRLPAYSGTQLA